MDVSWLTTDMNFNTPPLAQIAPFDARVASQTRKKAHLSTQLQGVEASTTARVPPQPGPEKASALSPSSSRVIGFLIGLSKLFAKEGDQSVS